MKDVTVTQGTMGFEDPQRAHASPTAAPVMLSGLKGVSTWCNICGCMADHNTLYHQDVINVHREAHDNREGGYGTIELLIAAVVLVILIVLLIKLAGGR